MNKSSSDHISLTALSEKQLKNKPLENMNFDLIPEELKARPRWVMWKYVLKGERSMTKPPVHCKTGYLTDITKPQNWSTYDTALKTFESGRYPGIGYVLGDGISGVDIDHLNEDTWKWALEVASVFNSYTEISPSGEGIHILVEGRLRPDQDRSRDTKKGIEIYDAKRFFTCTGRRVDGSPSKVNHREDLLQKFYDQIFPSEV